MAGRSGEHSACPAPPELDVFLATVEFPASREDLVSLADARGAPAPVREVLQALAPADFESPLAVRVAVAELSR